MNHLLGFIALRSPLSSLPRSLLRHPSHPSEDRIQGREHNKKLNYTLRIYQGSVFLKESLLHGPSWFGGVVLPARSIPEHGFSVPGQCRGPRVSQQHLLTQRNIHSSLQSILSLQPCPEEALHSSQAYLPGPGFIAEQGQLLPWTLKVALVPQSRAPPELVQGQGHSEALGGAGSDPGLGGLRRDDCSRSSSGQDQPVPAH